MSTDLTGKTAVITGGSRGIGAAIAEKFASLGANPAVICSGSLDMAEELCRTLTARCGVKAAAYQCNVADFSAVKQTVAAIRAEFKTVDILVNNAGITRDGLTAMMSEQTFDEVIAVDLKGAFNFIRHCTGLLMRSHGTIINISSISGLMGNAGQINYSAAKAGLVCMTKTVARELASRNVTCNAIAPGFIATDMTKGMEEHVIASGMIPLGRLGTAEEVADAAAFLAQNRYITGEVLRVDGGTAM